MPDVVEIKVGQTWASNRKPFRDIEILRVRLEDPMGVDQNWDGYVQVSYGWKTDTMTVSHLRRAYHLFDPGAAS